MNLAGITEQFNSGLGSLNETQQKAVLTQIVGREAVNGFSVVLSRGSEELREFTKRAGEQGTTSDIANAKLETFNGTLEILQGSLGLAAIELGEQFIPILQLTTKAVTGLVNLFIKLPEPLQTGIALFLGIGTAILGIATAVGFLMGPLTAFAGLFASGGALATFIPWISGTALPALTGAFTTLATTFTATVIPAVWGFTTALLANPITWIVLGVAALIVGIIALAKNWDLVTEKTMSFVNTAKSTLQPFFDWFKNSFIKIKEFFETFNLGEMIASGITAGFSIVESTMDKLGQKIRNFLPFSPAKVGPLSDIDQTGAGLVNTVSDSINRNKPILDKTMNDLTLAKNGAGSNGSSGGILVNINGMEININTGTDNINDIVNQVTESFRQKFRKELELSLDKSAAAVGV